MRRCRLRLALCQKAAKLDGLNLQKFQKNGGGVMTLTHYISGAEIEGTSGRVQDVFYPATGAVIDQVPLASIAEVDRVVAVARGPCRAGLRHRRQSARR